MLLSDEMINEMDPFMLVSIINMKLRDEYLNLEELCKSNNVDISLLNSRLISVGYEYYEKVNQFISK